MTGLMQHGRNGSFALVRDIFCFTNLAYCGLEKPNDDISVMVDLVMDRPCVFGLTHPSFGPMGQLLELVQSSFEGWGHRFQEPLCE